MLIWYFAGGGGKNTREGLHHRSTDRPFSLLQTAGAEPGIGERSKQVRDVGPLLFPGGLVPAGASRMDTKPPPKGKVDIGVLQELSTLRLSFPYCHGSTARAALLPVSAVLSLVQGRQAGLIVCSRLGSTRDSGWLGNKAAAWPRGEPAATKPSAAIHCRCKNPAQPWEGSKATFFTTRR